MSKKADRWGKSQCSYPGRSCEASRLSQEVSRRHSTLTSRGEGLNQGEREKKRVLPGIGLEKHGTWPRPSVKEACSGKDSPEDEGYLSREQSSLQTETVRTDSNGI